MKSGVDGKAKRLSDTELARIEARIGGAEIFLRDVKPLSYLRECISFSHHVERERMSISVYRLAVGEGRR
jgi:hypothetical protein